MGTAELPTRQSIFWHSPYLSKSMRRSTTRSGRFQASTCCLLDRIPPEDPARSRCRNRIRRFDDSTISEIVAGKRKLSVKQVKALARFFKVKAAVFLSQRHRA